MLASNIQTLESVPETMAEALADKEIRLRREARRRYEEDKLSAYSNGHMKGVAEEQNNLTALIQKMTENGKGELLPKLSNLDFLKKMYQKYQIQ